MLHLFRIPSHVLLLERHTIVSSEVTCTFQPKLKCQLANKFFGIQVNSGFTCLDTEDENEYCFKEVIEVYCKPISYLSK
jgi:hypothetical protein